MAKISVTEFINAPIDVVFDQATDFENCADFVNGIEKIEMLTDGPIRVGTRFKETRIMLKREATEEMEVTEFNRPTGYVLGANSCGCIYRSEFKLRERDGGTEIEMIFEGIPQTMFAKVMAFIMKPFMKSMMKLIAKDLKDVKTAVENRLETAS